MEFEYITFDCYGTLIDWNTGVERSLSRIKRLPLKGKALLDAFSAAQKMEMKSYAKYREVLRNAAWRLLTSFGLEAEESSYNAFAASVPEWPPYPDTADALRDLGKMGYRRYILSNVDTDLMEETIRRNRLEIDGYVTAEQVRSYKPNPQHWLEFMRKTGASRNRFLHVAQSFYHDIIPAQKLEIESAWINRDREPLDVDASPIHISDSLRSLVELLASSPS